MNNQISNEKVTMVGLTDYDCHLLMLARYIDSRNGFHVEVELGATGKRTVIDLLPGDSINNINVSQSYATPKEGQVQIVQEVYRFGHPQI